MTRPDLDALERRWRRDMKPSNLLARQRDEALVLIAYARDLERVRDAARGVMKSYESYCAVEQPKPRDEWDEYDHMMIPMWQTLDAALTLSGEQG